MKNIFTKLPSAKKEEIFETLLREGNVKIERITSLGQKTPAGIWLKEKTAEWVILLRGKAKILFYGEKKPRIMKPGDYVFIPAETRHRVEWTTPSEATVWLTVHMAAM